MTQQTADKYRQQAKELTAKAEKIEQKKAQSSDCGCEIAKEVAKVATKAAIVAITGVSLF